MTGVLQRRRDKETEIQKETGIGVTHPNGQGPPRIAGKHQKLKEVRKDSPVQVSEEEPWLSQHLILDSSKGVRESISVIGRHKVCGNLTYTTCLS